MRQDLLRIFFTNDKKYNWLDSCGMACRRCCPRPPGSGWKRILGRPPGSPRSLQAKVFNLAHPRRRQGEGRVGAHAPRGLHFGPKTIHPTPSDSSFVMCTFLQGCGAETIFFRSGSDRFYVKKDIFHVLMKENRPNSHVRSYSIWI